MSFRTKLFLIFTVTVLGSVSIVAYGVTRFTRTAFEEMDTQRTEAIVAQFQKEYVQRGDETSQQVKNIADADITLRVAIDLARPSADQSLYVHDATGAAQDHQMDFVELVGWDGTVISSAQNPSRVGHKEDWVTATKDWNATHWFLKKEDLADGPALSLTAVRSVSGGNDKNLYIVGGRRLARVAAGDHRAPIHRLQIDGDTGFLQRVGGQQRDHMDFGLVHRIQQHHGFAAIA